MSNKIKANDGQEEKWLLVHLLKQSLPSGFRSVSTIRQVAGLDTWLRLKGECSYQFPTRGMD